MTLAVAAAAGFLAIAAFQAALAFGAPLGRAAWGGINARLTARLRIASAVAVGIWVLAALIILGRAGFHVSPLPPASARWGTWILFGVNLLAALMNFASHSSWERFLWAPVALILAGLCLVVALSGSPARASAQFTSSLPQVAGSAAPAAPRRNFVVRGPLAVARQAGATIAHDAAPASREAEPSWQTAGQWSGPSPWMALPSGSGPCQRKDAGTSARRRSAVAPGQPAPFAATVTRSWGRPGAGCAAA